MTDAKTDLVGELVRGGLERREARWLVEEFAAGDDLDDLGTLRASAQRRLNGEPLQYIIGHWPFRSLDLDLDPRVLIPRPETEELVGIALEQLARSSVVAPVIMDMGCGSGAIGLALLSELAERGVGATLIAVDESSDALEVIRGNAIKHQLHAVSFVHSCWFDSVDESLRGHVDLIVANPPYVGVNEFVTLDPVLGYEPFGAIVSPDAVGVVGFEDLAIIIAEAPHWLSTRGVLVCEHGHEQGAAAVAAAQAVGFGSVEDLEDLAGRARVMVAERS